MSETGSTGTTAGGTGAHGLDDGREDVGRGEAAGRVVHEDDVDVVGERFEAQPRTESCRSAPPATTMTSACRGASRDMTSSHAAAGATTTTTSMTPEAAARRTRVHEQRFTRQ